MSEHEASLPGYDFDFTYQSTVRLALLGSALLPDFVTEGRALVLVGKPGRGKTHLAVAIANRAIQNGFTARFVTAAELIDDLSPAFRAGRLAEAYRCGVGATPGGEREIPGRLHPCVC